MVLSRVWKESGLEKPLCKTGYERFLYSKEHMVSTGDVKMDTKETNKWLTKEDLEPVRESMMAIKEEMVSSAEVAAGSP